jgi:hypothetical protein
MSLGFFVDEWVAGGIGGGAGNGGGIIGQAAGAAETSQGFAAVGPQIAQTTQAQRVARAVVSQPRLRATVVARRIIW